MWTPPRNNAILVRGYTIGWGKGIPDELTKLVDDKQRLFVIQNLSKFEWKYLDFFARNRFIWHRSIYFLNKSLFIYFFLIAEPNSEYVISLRAFNDVGDGRPIYETIRTREEEEAAEPATPLVPPVGLNAIVLSSSTVVLTWVDSSLPR